MTTLAVRNQNRYVKQGDTAELYAALRINEQPVAVDDVVGVNFIVQKPDGTQATLGGDILPDGRGFVRWTDTAEAGEYLSQAQFTLLSGEVRSIMVSFAVIDPFSDILVTDPVSLITEGVWMRLEDCFDSIEGGPWLRDKTLYNFNEDKIAMFIPEALLDINVQMPPTNFDISIFTMPTSTTIPNPNMPLLIKGTLVLTIRHLMRSYAEQAQLQGAQVVWNDRTRYTQMWQQIYQVEYADYISAVRLWKRTTLNLGHSALSVFSKAGRLYPFAAQRTRGIYRGFY